jgi:hypothetical protein
MPTRNAQRTTLRPTPRDRSLDRKGNPNGINDWGDLGSMRHRSLAEHVTHRGSPRAVLCATTPTASANSAPAALVKNHLGGDQRLKENSHQVTEAPRDQGRAGEGVWCWLQDVNLRSPH